VLAGKAGDYKSQEKGFSGSRSHENFKYFLNTTGQKKIVQVHKRPKSGRSWQLLRRLAEFLPISTSSGDSWAIARPEAKSGHETLFLERKA
jgi:hypothetical protein